MLGLFCILTLTYLVMVVVISSFAPKYYTYSMKKQLSSIVEEISSTDKLTSNEIQRLEHKYKITIIATPLIGNVDELNEYLLFLLSRKKVSLSKFWVTEEAINNISQGQTITRMYKQEKMNISYLTQMFYKNGELILVGTPIPENNKSIELFSIFFYFILLVAMAVLFVFILLFLRRMTKPLVHLKEVANDISYLTFRKATVKTGDELEDLAVSMNKMSENLEQAHSQLHEQNQKLTFMLASLSHELKTPITLMKAYGVGIEEHLDDGTFLSKIMEQADKMNILTEKFLALSKIQYHSLMKESLHLQDIIEKTIAQFTIITSNHKQRIVFYKKENTSRNNRIEADPKLLELLLSNCIQNAVKYSTGDIVEVSLLTSEDKQVLIISNQANKLDDTNDINQLFDPLYRAHRSNISGSGIGLTIVKEICEIHHFSYGVSLEDEVFTILIGFPSKPK